MQKRISRGCAHNQRVRIVEYSTAHTIHVIHSDGTIVHDSDFGDYTGTIEIVCYDCGYQKVFQRSNRPEWVKRLFDRVTVNDTTTEPGSDPALSDPEHIS